jgi:hypothetical protein
MSDHQLDVNALPMWVVYDHPRDHPDSFVARLWLTLPEPGATPQLMTAPTLAELREKIQAHAPWMVMLARDVHDDPAIVETWL